MNKLFLLLFLFLISLSQAMAVDKQADQAVAVKRHKVKEDLPNFHQVHPFLYRGGEPTEAGLKQLQEMGVKTIIDLRAPSESAIAEGKLAKDLGMKYINLVMTSAPPTKKQVDTVIGAIKKAQETPESGSVFLHCAHGSDRTGCLIGIWRVDQENWSYEDAYKEMRKYYFTPKFTRLSGAVKEYADRK
ncbi:MAG: tyrosine-protein phosphatase [Candidatus Obscuribacterales bacterium]|nr:tyrosine-protein phosphatase [Candidatus Obscuribacterales bacterium]